MNSKRQKNNINIIEVKDIDEGSNVAFNLLAKLVDRTTLLFLSGGNSPKILYNKIAKDQPSRILPGAIATVDERWGYPGHKNSNEKTIADTNLYKNLGASGTEIFRMLHGILNMYETADRYNTILSGLFQRFNKYVAIMGIGADGHTAGIALNTPKWGNYYVKGYKVKSSPGWKHPDRITLTKRAITKIDTNIILAFGKNKYQILARLTNKDTISNDIPADIYINDKKSYLITDQSLNY